MHTPGPWTVFAVDTSDPWITGPNDVRVARTFSQNPAMGFSHNWPTIEETQANGALIAAAPALLAALIAAKEYVWRYAELADEPYDGDCRKTLTAVETAIAAARGQG